MRRPALHGLPARVAVAALALGGLAACGDDEPVLVDDGSQGVPLAGLSAQLDDAGVVVVSDDEPTAATADQVVTALDDAGFERPTTIDVNQVPPTFTVDGDDAAGLLGLAAPSGGRLRVVVLVFGSTAAAAVLAAREPTVFADPASQSGATALLAGNLVAYVATGGPVDRVRGVLDDLATA